MTGFVETLTDPIPFWTKAWRDHLIHNPGVSGATSLALLKEHAREKLGKTDRERLALGLHAESVRLAGATALRRAFSNAEWMRAAQLADEPANPTKRLSDYLLRPYGEVSPGRWDTNIWELRASKVSASARNFALLIDALSEFTTEEHEQVCRRIFAGTSFAATAAETARYERLAARLDTLVRQTDKLVERVLSGTSRARVVGNEPGAALYPHCRAEGHGAARGSSFAMVALFRQQRNVCQRRCASRSLLGRSFRRTCTDAGS